MKELQFIRLFYGDKKAERSGVPYINHITEGLVILDAIGATELAKQVYCLHGAFQTDDDLKKAVGYLATWHFNPHALVLAMEYRAVANACLSYSTDAPLLSIFKEVNDALIADKVQNRKDFEIYHQSTHPRAKELAFYFSRWLDVLGISEERYRELAALITPS